MRCPQGDVEHSPSPLQLLLPLTRREVCIARLYDRSFFAQVAVICLRSTASISRRAASDICLYFDLITVSVPPGEAETPRNT